MDQDFLGEFLFALLGMAMVALLMRLIAKQKEGNSLVKSLQIGFMLLIVITLLLLLLKR